MMNELIEWIRWPTARQLPGRVLAKRRCDHVASICRYDSDTGKLFIEGGQWDGMEVTADVDLVASLPVGPTLGAES